MFGYVNFQMYFSFIDTTGDEQRDIMERLGTVLNKMSLATFFATNISKSKIKITKWRIVHI